jgi:hypothetical protein
VFFGKNPFYNKRYGNIWEKSMYVKYRLLNSTKAKVLSELKSEKQIPVSISEEEKVLRVNLEEGASISEEAMFHLSKGFKHSPEQVFNDQDLMEAAQKVAEVLPANNRTDFKNEFLKSEIRRRESTNKRFEPKESEEKAIRRVCREIVNKGYRVVQGDKDGMFGVLKESSFQEKKKEALNKNFKKIPYRDLQIMAKKKEVMDLLRDNNHEDLAMNINSQPKNWLVSMFTWKTHKGEKPFRPIISEKECWQGLLGHQIQFWLGFLVEDNPSALKSSSDLVPWLRANHGKKFKVASLDAKDMYFNLNIGALLLEVRRMFNKNNPIISQNKMNIKEDVLIKLIELYLSSTIIKDGKDYFTQSSGLPIGSPVAPRASEMILKMVDNMVRREIQEQLDNEECRLDRFIDDVILFFLNDTIADTVEAAYNRHGLGLEFTREPEGTQGLQFLEFKFSTSEGLCFEYSQRSEKPFLSTSSNHSRKVFNAVVLSALQNAAGKSCDCKVKSSLKKQTKRLKEAGYSNSQIECANRKLLRPRKSQNRVEYKMSVGIPQVHGSTHKAANLVKHLGVRVAGSHKNKLSHIPRTIGRMIENTGKTSKSCEHKDEAPFPCGKEVIYQIEQSCNKVYIGETSKCPNERYKEHQDGKNVYASYTDHVKKCRCQPDPRKCKVLSGVGVKGAHTRRVLESEYMKHKRTESGEDSVISNPSVIPTEWESILARKIIAGFETKAEWPEEEPNS